MKNYVADPQNPGKYLDTIELQKRNPQEPLPPVDIVALLKRDKWSRKDALLILAGYHPRNEVDGAGHPVGTVGAGIVFLDGTNQAMLDQAGLQHPRYPQMLYEFLPLAEYANGADDKEKSPQEWLAWAKGKGFTPYWMEYAEANQSAPSAKGGAAPDDGIKAIGQILAAAGMGVLALEVAKHEAIQQLQESPAANNLLNRYIALQPKSKPKPEVKEAPQPAQTAAQKVEAKPAAQIEAWRTEARKIGERIYKKKPTQSIEQIAGHVHKEMTKRHRDEKDPNMTGRGGKVPSAESIKRHALTGIKS